MSAKYAEGTSVSIDRSKAEIEKNLGNYGATEFGYLIKSDKAIIGFIVHGKQIRFVLTMPKEWDVSKTETGRTRSISAIETAFSQECRRRWRALSLIIKAKLESVETGIVSFEEEFLAHFVLPDGQTFAEKFVPQIEDIYAGKKRVAGLLE